MMKKPNLNAIIGKRQILLAALVLCLSLAVYMSWVYAGEDLTLPVTQTLEQKNYGDAQFVEGALEDADAEAYFAEAKLTRQRSRDEAVATLKGLIESESVSAEQRTELALKAASIADAVEAEGKIETLIRAKGFEDCMVYCGEDRVDVIVRTEGLAAAEAAQLKDVILREADVPNENISIIEVG